MKACVYVSIVKNVEDCNYKDKLFKFGQMKLHCKKQQY